MSNQRLFLHSKVLFNNYEGTISVLHFIKFIENEFTFTEQNKVGQKFKPDKGPKHFLSSCIFALLRNSKKIQKTMENFCD